MYELLRVLGKLDLSSFALFIHNDEFWDRGPHSLFNFFFFDKRIQYFYPSRSKIRHSTTLNNFTPKNNDNMKRWIENWTKWKLQLGGEGDNRKYHHRQPHDE